MPRPKLSPGEYGKVSISRSATGWTASARQRTSLGTVRQRSASAATQKAARDALQEILNGEANATDTGRAMSVQTAAQEWHQLRKANGDWQPTTTEAYRRHIDVDLAPLSNLSIADATPRVLRKFVRELTSTDAARRCRTILNQTFSHAISEGLISGANPATGITLPRRPSTNPRVLTEGELGILFAVADSDVGGYVSDGTRIQIGSGLRIGEFLGLRRRDFTDGPLPRVRVDGSIIQVGNQQPVRRDAVAKTPASIRGIPILPCAAEALRRRVEQLDAAGRLDPDELLFQTKHWTAVSPNNYRRSWRAVRGAHPTTALLTPHNLRATFATLAMTSGNLSAEQTASLLGHGAGVSTLYAHYFGRPAEIDVVWAQSPVSVPALDA